MTGSLFVIAPEGMATEGFYRMTISFVSITRACERFS